MSGSKIKKILITAGPTREMLDPVRFISNLSTGEMGYAIARLAKKKKYQVTLISGPTSLTPPKGIRFIPITSAQDLRKACLKEFPKHDALIMSAAVCDFTAKHFKTKKISRTKTRQLHLNRTPDIVAGLSRNKKGRLVVGFCLETEDWLQNAGHKLKKKNLDGIVANCLSHQHDPFGRRAVRVALIDKAGRMRMLKRQTKLKVARDILDWLPKLGVSPSKARA